MQHVNAQFVYIRQILHVMLRGLHVRQRSYPGIFKYSLGKTEFLEQYGGNRGHNAINVIQLFSHF